MKKIILLISIVIGVGWFFHYSLERIIIGPFVKSSHEGALVKTFFDTCITNLPDAQAMQSTAQSNGWQPIAMADPQILRETPDGIILGTWSRDDPQVMVLYTSQDVFPFLHGKADTCVVGMGEAREFFALPAFLSKFNLGAPTAEEATVVGTASVHKYDWLTTIQGKEIVLAIKVLSGGPISNVYFFAAVPHNPN